MKTGLEVGPPLIEIWSPKVSACLLSFLMEYVGGYVLPIVCVHC